MTSWKDHSGPKTVLGGIIYDYMPFWTTLGPLRYPRGPQNGPFIGSKFKIVVNFIYGYQNLSGEKYKGKSVSEIAIEEKYFSLRPII